jgi:hypothetical protein
VLVAVVFVFVSTIGLIVTSSSSALALLISQLALHSSSSLTFVDARWKTRSNSLGSAAKAANHIMLFHADILVSC